jgi:hypothetical protein
MPVSPSCIAPHSDGLGQVPLSFAQQRFWWAGQIQPASLNLPTAIQLKGVLRISALEQATRLTINRHDILRTRFCLHDGTPFQEILSSAYRFSVD